MPLSILRGLDLLVLDSSLYSRSEVEILPSLPSPGSERRHQYIFSSLITFKITSIVFLAGVFKCAVSAFLGYLLQVRKKPLGSVLDIPGEAEPGQPPGLSGLLRLGGLVTAATLGVAAGDWLRHLHLQLALHHLLVGLNHLLVDHHGTVWVSSEVLLNNLKCKM